MGSAGPRKKGFSEQRHKRRKAKGTADSNGGTLENSARRYSILQKTEEEREGLKKITKTEKSKKEKQVSSNRVITAGEWSVFLEKKESTEGRARGGKRGVVAGRR